MRRMRICCVQVVDGYGATYGSRVAAALEYAGRMGAHVVVTSVGKRAAHMRVRVW